MKKLFNKEELYNIDALSVESKYNYVKEFNKLGNTTYKDNQKEFKDFILEIERNMDDFIPWNVALLDSIVIKKYHPNNFFEIQEDINWFNSWKPYEDMYEEIPSFKQDIDNFIDDSSIYSKAEVVDLINQDLEKNGIKSMFYDPDFENDRILESDKDYIELKFHPYFNTPSVSVVDDYDLNELCEHFIDKNNLTNEDLQNYFIEYLNNKNYQTINENKLQK